MRLTHNQPRLGIDLGGTKIEAALLVGGEVAFRHRIDTPRGDYRATLDAIVKLIASIERNIGLQPSVGLATPGAQSTVTGLMKNANSVCLNGQDLGRDLAARIGRPVRIANDANCFALSEASDGAAAGAPSVFGVILGTGVGGGIVIDGKIVTGANAIAGEWGHNPLPWPGRDEVPGPACYCGRRGCIETFLSGPALERQHGSHLDTLGLDAKGLNATGIEAAAEAGDPNARATMTRYVDRLARALAMVINLLDPAVIVLGGGLSRMASLYRDVPARLPLYVFSDRIATRVVPPRHGDSSGVRGAAWLWPEQPADTEPGPRPS